jgi:ubiquinone/menaquinone biosynthesis C-methylase UbiE
MGHWDEIAARYDDYPGYGRLSPSEHAEWTALLRRLMDSDRPQRVLDVGTGTGLVALLLAELGQNVVGVDPSLPMLDQARRKASAAGLTVVFRAGDAYEPGLRARSVDVVIARQVLWLLPEPERAVEAWARVAVEGGLIVDIDGVWGPTATLPPALYADDIRGLRIDVAGVKRAEEGRRRR